MHSEINATKVELRELKARVQILELHPPFPDDISRENEIETEFSEMMGDFTEIDDINIVNSQENLKFSMSIPYNRKLQIKKNLFVL